MAKRIIGTTPKQDGYRMPAEFEPQQGVWMLWPERNDNWRDGGKPAQKAFADVAKAIAKFEKVTVWVKQLSGRERGAHLRQRQTKPLRPVPLIGDAGHFFNKAFLLRCGACPTHTVFAAQLKEYLIKTFFLCIFAAIPRRIRRRSDFIHIHAKHLLAENQSR